MAIQDRSQRTGVTQDYVIEKLKTIADKQASDAPDSDLKYSSQIKAIELLGKHLGAWEPQNKQQTAVEDLTALAEKLRV